MTALVLASVMVVRVSAPPLSPDEAVRVLRASKSPADRTDARSLDLDGPMVIEIRSRPADGPFGPFPKYVSPPPQGPPVIRFRLPRMKGRR